ncbi:Coenzyme F420 hydrogenase/dehydrogenase, beta subunit C-terminal domain [Acetomicrobium sp. UBA5826]|uniref:Coenzyme F420 hydrogenase/dehydrogenase, beta subunit C-terminal domain n=1 Tax=Acetomicrobium sp. UBA5826 TaxID=1946039 RepID=UPI00257C09E0|nr:Coenzyme F420 hydrogenase/dehydrogenase, beta subunit C-terminal domain [Acetomicrobium sp. UBA5826]
MHETIGFQGLKEDVVNAGLCTGCGTCAGVCPLNAISMDYEADEPEPILTGKCSNCGACYDVCPGKHIPLPQMDKQFLGKERDFENDHIGIYRYCGRGYSKDNDIRGMTSSGGMISSLLICALEEKLIDAVLLAGWRDDKPWRCKPFIATNAKEVLKALRTGMMVVPNNALLYDAVKKGYKNIGIVGCPCHVHGIRKLQLSEKTKKIANSVKLVLGLFCAATYYWEGTKHLLQEFGKIEDIQTIKAMDYRGGKWPGGLEVLTTDDKIRYVASKHDYTWHLFGPTSYKRDRCLVCVDFSSEVADVSCGDIFQDIGYKDKRWVATVVRTKAGEELVKIAKEKGYIYIEDHDPRLIPASGMGWESKKHAGVYRLLQRKKYNWPVPDYGYELSENPLMRDIEFPK